MASTFTDLLRIEKQADGENDSTWGSKTNTNFEMFEDAIAGRAAITHSDAASYSLTTSNAATDEARNMILNIGGALTAARNTVVPTSSKLYVAKNATTGGFATTLKTTAGTGISIPNGNTTLIFCDGTNVVDAINYLSTLTIGSGLTVTAGVTKVGDGLVGAPTYSFVSDPTKGFWSNASNQITLSITGSAAHSWSAGGYTIANNSGTLNIGASADVVLTRDAADVLAQRRTTNAQVSRVYNTFTDASNYERMLVGWASNIATIESQSAGTGTARGLQLGTGGNTTLQFYTQGTLRANFSGSGHFLWNTDNTLDIGASGANRPRSFYWGTQALGPDGSAGTPSISFASQTGRGFYVSGGGIGGAVGGAIALQINSGSLVANSFVMDLANGDVIIARDAANVLAQRNTTTAQEFRLYNTFTDASNYERLRMIWTGNAAFIETANAGTGTARSLTIGSVAALFFRTGASLTNRWQIQSTGELLAGTDNTLDIGATGANRPRDFYLGRNAVIGGDITIAGASMVQNSKSAAYTTVAADANKHILHPTADNNARTFTIDSNANVAYTIGTCITFVNQINTLTIAITSDTLTWIGPGTTGSRTLAANGLATALKVAATSWVISGDGLS